MSLLPMAYPIVLLSPWLVRTIADNVDTLSTYSNNIVSKGFIKYRGPGECNIPWTPILRVFMYTKKTKQSEISAILNDSSHKILAIFSRKCILNFEAKYSQRLTYNTLHSLIIVRDANLRFATPLFLRESFGRIGGLTIAPGTEIVYLEILDIDIFHRDQMEVDAGHENMLRFVYGDKEYRGKFGKDKANDEIARMIFEQNDGVISEDEMVGV